MTIHSSNPFAQTPDQVRRFRGRLGGAVTLWTTGSEDDRAGLTVSSLMVGLGDPGRVFALLDPDADLTELLEETSTAVVHLLQAGDEELAEAFAGTFPAPGGPFRMRAWEGTPYGPRLAGRSSANVRLESVRPAGWSVLVEAVIEDVQVLEGDAGLEHRRGRYHHSEQKAGLDPSESAGKNRPTGSVKPTDLV